jgi:hypothetical protein
VYVEPVEAAAGIASLKDMVNVPYIDLRHGHLPVTLRLTASYVLSYIFSIWGCTGVGNVLGSDSLALTRYTT